MRRNDDFYMSGPEEGDTIDQSVYICDDSGRECIEVRSGSLRNRKKVGRQLAQLLNEAKAEILPI